MTDLAIQTTRILGLDFAAVDRHNNVAGLEPRLFRRAAGNDAVDTRRYGFTAGNGEDRGEDPLGHPQRPIEATGQRALSAIQFPFLSLLEQGIVRDEVAIAQFPMRRSKARE